MEFLIPTLQVAKDLNWIGHELSKRLEEVEKLDETRLAAAIAGMYVLRSNFMIAESLMKEFQLGDLFMVFTLKEFQAKFTKRGQGPYMISRLSSSGGVVKLSTLGDEMPNWISGCRIKKYNVPLMQAEWKLYSTTSHPF